MTDYRFRKMSNKKVLQSIHRLQHFVFLYIFVSQSIFFDTNVTSPLVGSKTFQEVIYAVTIVVQCIVTIWLFYSI